ncbi:MAG: ABC transporter substrate-binding protein [Synergistales bacterium]|nr:ABC transporter substrate-binding protein [Synergistales bacterium]
MRKGVRIAVLLIVAASLAAFFLLPRNRDTLTVAILVEHDEASFNGRKMRQSLLFAMDHFNSRADGAPVRYRPLVVRGRSAREGVEHAVDAGADVVMAGFTSGETEAVMRAAYGKDIPCISPSGSSPRLAQGGDFLFRCYHDSAKQSELLVRGIRKEDRPPYLIVAERGNRSYVEEVAERFVQSVGEAPRMVCSLRGYAIDRWTLAQMESLPLRAAGAFLVLSPYACAAAAQQLRERFPDITLWCSHWSVSRRSALLAGSSGTGMEAVVPGYLGYRDRGHPFVRFMEERYGSLPDPFFGVKAYDAMAMLDAAVRRVDGDARKLLRGLRSLNEVECLNGRFPVDANGDIRRPFSRVRLEGGRWNHVEEVSAP